MALLILSISWLIGIYLGSKVSLPIWTIGISALPFILMPFLSNIRRTLLLTGFFVLLFISGCLLSANRTSEVNDKSLQFYNDKESITISGMIEDEPEIRDRSMEFQLSATHIYQNNIKIDLSGKALVKALRTSEYHYGDIIKVRGNLETPQRYEDFDYKEYLSRDEIYSVISYPSIELIERNKGNPVLSAIYTLRNSLSMSLSRALSEPQCSLAQGILLGMTGTIPYTLKQNFNITGTTHLLAISGLNLSIIIGMLLSLGIWLFGKNHALYIWLALIAIWFYSILTGMKPPVVRSAVMGSMFLLAEFLGRQQNSGIILFFTAAVMVGINTKILEDASFQLSFVAMAGLIFIYPVFRSLVNKTLNNPENSVNKHQFQRFTLDSIFITISATIATWPLVAYYFGIISLTGLPATFFALPAMPLIIITSAIVGFTGIFIPILAQITGWTAWLFLSYFIFVIQVFAEIPFSWLITGTIPAWFVLCYYIVLASVILIVNNIRQFFNFIALMRQWINNLYLKSSAFMVKMPRKLILIPLLVITILIWAAIITLPDDKLHVSILNVGQGDAILIQTASGKNILIDGGPSPQAVKIELGKKLPFWNRTIDLMIATQPQADHITGLVEVIQCYTVKEVMDTGLTYDSKIYTQLLNAIKEKGIKYEVIHDEQKIQLDNDTTIDVLYPPQFVQVNQSTINDNSLVLRLNYKNRHFLLAGDISKLTEYYLISQRFMIKSDVLKVAHHGSRTSTTQEFLQSTQMKAAVISAGENNKFGHPHSETINRILEHIDKNNIFITQQHGTVEFISDGDKLWVKTGY